MIQIHHLTLSHRKDLRPLLTDFSLTLHPGDKAVIVGEEGNGKSTLLKWIYDPALIDGYAEGQGQRILQGETLGYLPQELPEAERKTRVCDYFNSPESFRDRDPAALSRLAARLRLPAELFCSPRPMETLSGGEKVKLQMARLLMARPDVWLLDEPSNDIDVDTLEWMEDFIRQCRGIVLFISHDETLIEAAANRVILLEQLRRKTASRWTVANVPFRQFMAERSAGFDRQAQLAQSERREERIALEKFRRIQQKVEHQQNAISRQDPHGGRLLKKKMASVKAVERRYRREHQQMTEYPEQELAILVKFHGEQAVPPGKVVLDLALPELRRPDGAVLARNVNLTVQGPEKICLTGANGAGKTTLLRQILALLEQRPDLQVCYMPQNYEDLLELDETPIDYLAPSGHKDDVTVVRTYLGSLRYTPDEMSHAIRELSGGQKAKLLLLKMSLSGANVLLLDEPTRNFSPLSGPEVRALLRSFPGAIISVSHDRKYLAEVADKVYALTADGLQIIYS
ncbi:MAG: ABC-F family ATP-binding cassette domain-containing protein [Oscillospiraceae bacterium]|nr:ABC-F family ATP-binding cassette domain-containing protein [Oscillospiraceae bacterium]